MGKGWFRESIRHSNAVKSGSAGPIYHSRDVKINLKIKTPKFLMNYTNPNPKIVVRVKKNSLPDFRKHKTSRKIFENIAGIKNELRRRNINGDIEKRLGELANVAEIIRKREKRKVTFERGKKYRAKRDVLARRLSRHKKIKSSYGLATYQVKKGRKIRNHEIKREFKEQKKMSKKDRSFWRPSKYYGREEDPLIKDKN